MTKFLQVARQLGGSLINESIADQVINAADTYITGSIIAPPSIPARSHFIWKGWMTKTAAGLVAPVFNLRLGTLGTIADAVRVALVSPSAQTAAVDDGFFEIHAIMRAVGATAVIHGELKLGHGAAAAGFAVTPSALTRANGAAFNLDAITLPYLGLSIDPGAAGVWTLTGMIAEMKQT